jgi:HK97 family phage major capsid protein
LGLDASITPTPAEHKNLAQPLKSINVKPLMDSDQPMDDLVSEGTDQDGGDKPKAEDKSTKKDLEVDTMEITEERLKELIDEAVKSDNQEVIEQAVAAGVEKAMKALPAVSEDVKVEVELDEADQPFESDGHYFQAVKNAALFPAQQDVRLIPLSVKATGLSENVPADGGYLLAPQVAGGIIERMYDVGDILSRVSADPIGPNSNSMLYNAVDESSRADGSRYGGVRGYWLAEGGTKTASAPTFRQMELKLKKVAALCYATDELLADATALESWLGRTVPEELRFQVESAFYRGNGVGKPLGIMNSPCLVSVTRIDANQVDQTDIANMWARRWQGVDDYVWLSNASVFPQLINLTVGNFPFLLPMSAGGQGDPAFSLYGKPYIESEYTYALGTTGDIMLASLSQYQTITKGGVQAASSIHVQFTTDETAFRFVYRTDGQPLWNSALTPYDAGSTLSPFVVLTAASV